MKAAFLSSALISSKGSAGPATQSLNPDEVLARSKRAEALYKGDRTVSTPSPTPLQPPRARQILQKQNLQQKQKTQSEKLKKDALGRVRMSVRITPEQHLHLKLIAAHAHQSAQSIIEQALNDYVERHGSDLIPGACACIRDKVFR